ncbi:MAG: pyruvate ferredoxin oxidoreductase [Deltaproteobacteria bacterium CG11_big_fil_rev_8_21_14_0_20_49_13]|nr:MAG: pyruvate ferredoxin oxidoreductase [Deltaproteobacteria bacterium CG11_big_fil_rev_8_21_14_0_20_49_13]
MGKRVGMEVSLAVSEAVKHSNTDVVAAYPITPQTHIVESLSEIIAEGLLDAEFVCVESEHSAMSACLGSSSAGARTFTATAGQGLELMHEVVYVAASMRLPIVMAVANRALSAPLSVWGDHSDVMAVRDTGWIQIFCENGQDAYDLTLWAFKCAEDRRVLFPVMVNLDGFHLTHVVEPVYIEDQEKVTAYLPKNNYPLPLDPRKPVTMGAFGPPFIYTEARKAQVMAFEETLPVIKETLADFGKTFGRNYNLIEKYRMDDAETALITMGSFSQTAMEAVDQLRAEGGKAGLIRIRLWRPFPFEDFRNACKGVKTLAILDRAVSFGGPIGPVASEVRSALYPMKERPFIASFIGGLGGRDIYPEQFKYMFTRAIDLCKKGEHVEYEMIGVRE